MIYINIGIDIDGVLTINEVKVWESALIDYFKFEKRNNNKERLINKYGLSRVDMLNFYDDCTNDIVKKIKVNQDAKKMIDEISKDNNIYIITARNKSYATKDWLFKNKVKFDRLIHNHKKDKECNRYDIDIHIDDSADMANKIAKNTSTIVYLLDKPYNQDVDLDSKVYRVNSIKEVKNIIKGVVFYGSEKRW